MWQENCRGAGGPGWTPAFLDLSGTFSITPFLWHKCQLLCVPRILMVGPRVFVPREHWGVCWGKGVHRMSWQMTQGEKGKPKKVQTDGVRSDST